MRDNMQAHQDMKDPLLSFNNVWRNRTPSEVVSLAGLTMGATRPVALLLCVTVKAGYVCLYQTSEGSSARV